MTIPAPTSPPPETHPKLARVIAIAILKGGTGKTHFAVLIALFLTIVMGRKVVLIDADKTVEGTDAWRVNAGRRGYDFPVEVISYSGDKLHLEIDKILARGDVDEVIVDVGGGEVATFLSAMRRAHKVISPINSNEGEIEAAPKTRDHVIMGAALSNIGRDLELYFFLNRVRPNGVARVLARESLLTEDQPDERGPYPLLDAEVPQVRGYENAFGRIPGPPNKADVLRPSWKDLKNFIPVLVETGIITREEALGTGLIIDRQLKEANL